MLAGCWLDMRAKMNVPKSTLLVVGLLALILLTYTIYGGQSKRRKLKRIFIPKSLSQASHIYVSASRSANKVLPFLEQPNGNAGNKSAKVKVRKLSKPVVKEFYLYWKKEGRIFYREIIPNGTAKLDILLLHGTKFNSSIWVHLKTMNLLVSSGFRVIAMDLPSCGKSSYKFKQTDKTMGKFLAKFIKKTRLRSPVIVSPSASGKYSLPYIVWTPAAKVSGFVPIAVVATDRFPAKDYKRLKAPTLIMRGSKDITLGKTSMETLQKAIPNSKVKVIEGAGHACYVDKPKEFHEALLQFLNGIVKKRG